MARAGMLQRGGKSGADGGDDVQRSLELLDQVLSEFDEGEPRSLDTAHATCTTHATHATHATHSTHATQATPQTPATPDDDSPSLTGHQSEDDGYMSMNGRRAKFALGFRPTEERDEPAPCDTRLAPRRTEPLSPPPPEEAQRIIETLLPILSPAKTAKTEDVRPSDSETFDSIISVNGTSSTTQVTLPKTRHQRPYGWERGEEPIFQLQPPPVPPCRFASLQHATHQHNAFAPRPALFDKRSPSLDQPPYFPLIAEDKPYNEHPVTIYPGPNRHYAKPNVQRIPPFRHHTPEQSRREDIPEISPGCVPPRTLAGSMERHRQACRVEEAQASDAASKMADDDHFSDDSLEEAFPSPPAAVASPTSPNKRNSIAWEVSLDDESALTPGSTKVIGRRRRKSGDNSRSSPARVEDDYDYWPPPPDPTSPPLHALNSRDTYVIRKGKSRKQLPAFEHNGRRSPQSDARLTTPNSRYSIDIPTQRILDTPKSRLSLDLNSSSASVDLANPKTFASRQDNFLNRSPKGRDDFLKRSPRQDELSPQNRFGDVRKHSSTFDSMRSLMREGRERCEPPLEETTAELTEAAPGVVRVVSLPSLNDKEPTQRPLITTVEEEEDTSGETSPLRKIENNINAILSQGRDQKLFASYAPKDWNIHRDEYEEANGAMERQGAMERLGAMERRDLHKSSSHNEIGARSAERRVRRSGSKSAQEPPGSLARQTSSSDSAVSSGGDFPVTVHVVEHPGHSPAPADLGPLPQTPESPSFPPLPPSPVQEDDEYSEILQPRARSKADTMPAHGVDPRHRSSEPPAVPPHRDSSSSLKTRSMEGGYSKHKRQHKPAATDRRTLPTDVGASGARRRTLQRQSRDATPPGRAPPLQTSASLPETPIFARGCDVPRTPLRHALAPRQSNTMNSIQTIGGSSTLGGYGRGSLMCGGASVDRAIAGVEMLRLAGGPQRGWYPRQRHRPASTEHLDRLTGTCKSAPDAAWSAGARKPLTLPPNLTPKFFQRSPREALRRVTSLLIRKGNAKEVPRKKEAVSPAARSAPGEDHPGQKQRKGFFRSLWKRSRHYSLEHP